MPKFEIRIEKVTRATTVVAVEGKTLDAAISAGLSEAEALPIHLKWEYSGRPAELLSWKLGK